MAEEQSEDVRKVTTHEAKTHLSRLLTQVQAGEQVTIYRGNQPAAHLVPVVPGDEVPGRRRRPPVGTKTSGPVSYAPDAFEPLSDRELEDWGL